MSRDLERQLDEMGPAYREVVARLRRAREVSPRPVRLPWRRVALAAASLVLVVGLAAVLLGRGAADKEASSRRYTVRVTDAAREYLLAEIRNDEAVKEMIRTQNLDGSWKNDFLTRRNAAALRKCDGIDAKIAYKKAMRNLRSKGFL